MTAHGTSAPTRREISLARLGVGIIFLCNGAGYASLVPRLPEVKADLELTNAMFGIAIAAYPAGALISGAFAGLLMRRLGSPLIAWGGMVVAMLGILAAAVSPVFWMFCAAIFLAGCGDAVTDVAQNHHGLRVQKLHGKSIINSYHAMWSVGALLGGIGGAAALGLDLGRVPHLIGVAVLLIAATTVGWKLMLPGPEPTEIVGANTATENVKGRLGHPIVILAALSAIALAGAVIEESAGTWATLYMTSEIGATGWVAALAYVSAMGMHFAGRLSGDPLVDRFGQRKMALYGGALVAAGMLLAILIPTTATTIIGYGLAGFGVATVIPSVFEAADAMPGLKPGSALTVTSLVLRIGFLASPPLVGVIADASAIRWGLLLVPLAGLVVMALAWVLSDRQEPGNVPVPTR